VAVWWPYNRKYYEDIVRKIKGRGKNRKITIYYDDEVTRDELSERVKIISENGIEIPEFKFPLFITTTSTNRSSFGNIYDK